MTAKRKRARIRRQRETGCPTCGHWPWIRPRGGRVRVTMPRFDMVPAGRNRWRFPRDLPKGTPRPSIRLGRWERNAPAGALGRCPDRWHEKAEPALRREEKRRR